MKTLLVGINAKFIHSNLAIRYLREYALSKGKFDITLVEYTINQPLSLIMQEILKINPAILGFSCYIWNYDYVKKLCIEFKKLLPNCHIFIGGPEVSYTAEQATEECSCDSIISGEGEAAFLYLLESLHNGVAVPKIISMPPIPLDDIPPIKYDFSNLENRIIYYEASRGCPFSCQYCLSGGSHVRFLSCERVFTDLKVFLDKNIRQVKFIDRTFNCNKDFAMSIWHFIAENDNGITNFHFEIASELLTDAMIAFLQTVRRGLFQFEIGIQSTNPPTLQAIKRITETELITRIVSALHKSGNIHLHLDLIAGLPYEGYSEFKNSFNYVYSLAPEQLQLGFLKLLKGSGLYSKKDELTLVHTDFPPYEVIQTKWLSYSDIARLKLIEELVETYYNSNRYKKTVEFLARKFDSPFDFFEQLSNYYEKNSHHLRPHSKIEYYDILWEFTSKHFGDNTTMTEIAKSALYDIYSHEKASKLPSWLFREVSDEDKRRIKDFYDNADNRRLYLPQYDEFDTKQLIRNAHIEIFRDNDTETAVLFNYRDTDILGNAHTETITL